MAEPNVPWWLPKYAQGEVAGTPMRGYPVSIPSGQLWYRTPSSQREGLEAYINRYAGSVPGMVAAYQDLLDKMYLMLPRRSPTTATQWTTARQW
jgi:hypothetical protein